MDMAGRVRCVFETPKTDDVQFFRNSFELFWTNYRKGLATFLQPLTLSHQDKIRQYKRWHYRWGEEMFWAYDSADEFEFEFEYFDEEHFDTNSFFIVSAVTLAIVEDAVGPRLGLQLAGIPEGFLACIFDLGHGVREDWANDMSEVHSDIHRQLVEGLYHLGFDVETTIAMGSLRAAWMGTVICLQMNRRLSSTKVGAQHSFHASPACAAE
jgi:hypothetical protein